MTIVITLPYFFPGEALRIEQLLRGQVELVHIRKPDSTRDEVERLIRELPTWSRGRIVLHDHHDLAIKYSLHGVHLNGRNPEPPRGWTGSVSRSCHSLEEVEQWKERCQYVSLSPIFDSISKQGYRAAFTTDEICSARERGIIDSRVMALGGVTFDKIDEVMSMGFGGGMILGDAWKDVAHQLAPAVLSVAGSDSSAGAGIQQDLKTMTAVGVYGATAITAVTSQNTMGITDVMAMPARVVRSQMEAVLADLNVRAIKIGMIPDADVAHAVATTIAEYRRRHECHVVYDTVMVSTSGKPLMEPSCVSAVVGELLPLCSLVTPNLLEARRIVEETDACADIAAIARRLGTHILVKGGHSESGDLSDCLYSPTGETRLFPTERIDTHNLHGTGCTLSSAIAAYLAKGLDMTAAIKEAKLLLTEAIRRSKDARIGKGNGPLIVR